jgi:threonine synthase
VLPVCYGDALLGMWRGFEDMVALGWTDRMPRMVAAETYGSIGTALAEGGDALPDMRKNHETVAVSIGATRGTYQALDIVRRSGGTALTVGNAEMMRWQQILAEQQGLFVEPASAASLAAVEQLALDGQIAPLKDPATTAAQQQDLLPVPANFDAAVALLTASKIFPDRPRTAQGTRA